MGAAQRLLINAADYDFITGRLDTIERALAWVETKGRNAADRIVELLVERSDLDRRLERIEDLNAYDEMLD